MKWKTIKTEAGSYEALVDARGTAVATAWPSVYTPGLWCGKIGVRVYLSDSEEEAKASLEAEVVALRVEGKA